MSEDFDVHEVVTEYRQLTSERDSKPADFVIWFVLGGKASYVRDMWKTMSGQDDLHFRVFGEWES